jgi:hypothetical protein
MLRAVKRSWETYWRRNVDGDLRKRDRLIDSGTGAHTVLRKIIVVLPRENTIYCEDTATTLVAATPFLQ